MEKKKISIAAVSDTHMYHSKLKIPDADVLVFAGDFMTSGYRHSEVKDFGEWFSSQTNQYKILVAGNHDKLFESDKDWCLKQFKEDVIYLENSSTEIRGWKFYGSPVQPWFYDWAFNVQPAEISKVWEKIPSDTDILITHGPAYGVGDKMVNKGDKYYDSYNHLGCPNLLKKIYEIKPRVHIFGHIHGGAGMYLSGIDGVTPGLDNTVFHNVAICDENYEAKYQAHQITLFE